MQVTCVTSRYLPNLRHIARLLEVDCAIILDLAPLPHRNKDSFVSRNRINANDNETAWISLPIHRKAVKFIKDAKIEETNYNWIEKHIGKIAHTYPNHQKVAGNFLERLEEILRNNDATLLDINNRTLKLILEMLGYNNINLINQSSIIQAHDSLNHRLDVANALNATSYLAGHVEWNYMEQVGINAKMEKCGISVFRSPDLDPLDFSKDCTVNFSCVHSICTKGLENTHLLIDNMVQKLKEKNRY